MHMDFLRSSSRKGRSRFSKALPIPPPPAPSEPAQVSSPTTPNSYGRSKQLPTIPPVPSPRYPVMSDKPLPPPQPLNQSLPPLPPLETKALPFMNIQRRPVAKPAAPPPPSQSEQHSPTGSIGSLLSAYSRSSGESLMRSADGSASQRDSTPKYAPEQNRTGEAKVMTPTSLSSGDYEGAHSHLGAQRFTNNKDLPPAPAFDTEMAPPPPAKPGHAAGADSPTSFASPSLPQRPIWRRRSVKSDRNIEVPDLKLAVSHGSTAASQPNTAQPSSYSAAAPPPAQQQFPPGTTSGLPGRNIRPVQQQNQAPAPRATDDEMGQEASRLRNKVSRLRGEEGPNVGASHSDAALSPTQRLPTPDYEKEDVKTPVVDTVVSPISPASSPEPAPEQAASEAKPPPIPRKAVTARNIHNAQSLPQLRVDEPVTSSEAPPTITRDFAISPLSSPEAQGQQGQFPPRKASNQQRAAQPQPAAPHDHAYAHAHAHAPAPVQQPGGGMRPASRPGQGQEAVEYRELKEKDLPPADPRASFFPITTPEPPSPSIIYNARPLKESMLDCYVRHRVMDRTRNRNYALTCQTCGKADTEDRFKCQWCYVRMCASCFKIFNGERRDLRKLLAHLEGNPQSSDSQGPVAPTEEFPAEHQPNAEQPIAAA
ncbi:hypothetical protein CSOJ01_01639 [Colletotrichum sojae]|uniref:Uncharacterized protein n=1 Tax=Colletotrichum sojae TaxID=2175907 RepID=A0A8H6JT93_9PEZI|nr:hypothetical protein CSOJ01_01639 [Colletotrichum sojae]